MVNWAMRPALALILLALAWALTRGQESPAAGEPAPLMSIEQYAGIHHDRPYVVSICARDGQLRYVGTQHTVSTTGPTVRSLIRELEDFRPDVLLVEGPA